MSVSINNSGFVNGLQRVRISVRMFVRIIHLALRQYDKPIDAIKSINTINKRKVKIQSFRTLPKIYYNGNRFFYELHTPGWPSPSFDRFISNELRITRQNKPDAGGLQNAVFAVTGKCKFKCKHCFEWDNISSSEHLSYSELAGISKRLEQAGVSIIQISGGEPLERFEDICRLCNEKNNGTDYWLLTSGYELTSKRAYLLKSAGYTGINISLDHWKPELHDQFRRKNGSFDWVLKAIENVRNNRMIPALTLCARKDFITEENLHNYYDLACQIKAAFVQILEPRAVGKYRNSDVAIEQEQYEIIDKFYRKVNNTRRFLRNPVIVYHRSYQLQYGCLGAGNRYIYIDSKGMMHACPFCQNPIGNVLKEPLNVLLNKTRNRGCHLYKSFID